MSLPAPVARRREHHLGQSLVEFALILPVFMVLVAATLDLGRMFYGQITITNAAREAALEAARDPSSWAAGQPCDATTNRVMCRALNEAAGSFVAIAPADVSLTCTPTCGSGIGNMVRVTVAGHFTLLTPLMAAFTGGQHVTFDSTASIQIATPPAGGVAATPPPSSTPSPSGSASPTPEPSASATPAPCLAPEAQFIVSPTSGFASGPHQAGTVFVFTDQSTNMLAHCAPVWSWNFGDGAGTSSLQDPTYVYTKQKAYPGYLVTLVVTNSAGYDTATVSIPVSN